jgi:hypothetical protein
MYGSDQQHRIGKEGGGGGAGEDCGSRSEVKTSDVAHAMFFQNIEQYLHAGKKNKNKLKTMYDGSKETLIAKVADMLKRADKSGRGAEEPNLLEDLVSVITTTSDLVDRTKAMDMATYLCGRCFCEEGEKED